MNEKRRAQRIQYQGTGWLHHKGAQYFIRLDNISICGAMINVRDTSIGTIQCGEQCCLKLFQDAEGQQYTDFMAKIVRCNSSEVGLEFSEAEGDVKDTLENIIRKEQHLFNGAHKFINLAREVAENRGIELTDVHFDKGNLIPERDIHTLRFFAGKHTANVHLHRADIEKLSVHADAVPAHMIISKAIDRLHG